MAAAASLDELRRQYYSGLDPLAYLPYAAQLLKEQQYAQALDVCLRGLESRPSLTGRRLLAQVYFDMGRYGEALRVLEAMLNDGGESFAAQLLMARTLVRCGRWKEAASLIECLKKMNPWDDELNALDLHIQAELERSELDTPVEEETPQQPAQRLEALQTELAGHKEVGFCWSLRPEAGNVLETSSLEQLLSIVLDKSSRIVAELGLGAFQEIMVEFEQGYVLSRRSESEFLTVQFATSMSPGQMRQSLGRFAPRA